MTIQVIVVDTSPEAVSAKLGGIAVECEIFSMDGVRIGVSIPEKVLGDADENWLHNKFLGLPYYDLYTGEWHSRE
jgi:hypothetical protein